MQCPICKKDIPKSLYMHACHMAARLRDGEHLALANRLFVEEQTANLAKVNDVKEKTQEVIQHGAADNQEPRGEKRGSTSGRTGRNGDVLEEILS